MAFSSIYFKNQFHVCKNLRNKVRFLSTNAFYQRLDEIDKSGNLSRKVNELNDWYCKLTGLDEVKLAQDKVIQNQERLEKAQQERREIGKLLLDVRQKSNAVQEELEKTRRWEEIQKYLDLRRQESEIIKTEKDLQQKFELLDKSERDIFSALCAAVRDSQEKERSQASLYKYWSFIFSIVGTLLGASVSFIYSYYRNKSLIDGINKSFDSKVKQIEGVVLGNNLNKFNFEEIVNNQNQQRNTLEELNKTCGYLLQFNQETTTKINEISKNIESSFKKVGLPYKTPDEDRYKVVRNVALISGAVIFITWLLGSK